MTRIEQAARAAQAFMVPLIGWDDLPAEAQQEWVDLAVAVLKGFNLPEHQALR